MTWARIAAILFAICAATLMERFIGASIWFSFASGVIVYLGARYIAWAILERRRFKDEMAQMVEKAKRGEPLDL